MSAHDSFRTPDDVDLDGYLNRIGYQGSLAPDLDTLRGIQELHPAAIPFEAIDVLLDRGVDLSPTAVDRKLIDARRGGYCFEHNGLLQRVLQALGFRVEGLLARVCWMAAADAPPAPATHMALRVFVDGEPWLVDVGFGSTFPASPLPMRDTSPQATRHETYRLAPQPHSAILQARLGEDWVSLYEVLPGAAVAADYEVANWFTSTHPTSHFRRNLTVARTTPQARYALLDDRLTVRTPDGGSERRYLDADGIERALDEIFGLPVTADWRPVIERAAADGATWRGEVGVTGR